jgi:hypothetical protein
MVIIQLSTATEFTLSRSSQLRRYPSRYCIIALPTKSPAAHARFVAALTVWLDINIATHSPHHFASMLAQLPATSGGNGVAVMSSMMWIPAYTCQQATKCSNSDILSTQYGFTAASQACAANPLCLSIWGQGAQGTCDGSTYGSTALFKLCASATGTPVTGSPAPPHSFHVKASTAVGTCLFEVGGQPVVVPALSQHLSVPFSFQAGDVATWTTVSGDGVAWTTASGYDGIQYTAPSAFDGASWSDDFDGIALCKIHSVTLDLPASAGSAPGWSGGGSWFTTSNAGTWSRLPRSAVTGDGSQTAPLCSGTGPPQPWNCGSAGTGGGCPPTDACRCAHTVGPSLVTTCVLD